jgi:hypothetical protein
MKYVIEIGSGTTIYITSFIKIGSGIQKLLGAGNAIKMKLVAIHC